MFHHNAKQHHEVRLQFVKFGAHEGSFATIGLVIITMGKMKVADDLFVSSYLCFLTICNANTELLVNLLDTVSLSKQCVQKRASISASGSIF